MISSLLLFRCGYQLVVNKYGEYLYANVQNTLRDHLRRCAFGLTQISDFKFLQEFVAVWRDYQMTLRTIADVLMYMDRQFCLLRGQKVALFIMGIELFRQELLEFVPLTQRLLVQLSLEIKRDRLQSGRMDRRLIRNVISMISHSDPNLSFYRSRRQDRELADILRTADAETIKCDGEFFTNLFELKFLEETSSFYIEESSNAISELSVIEYLDKVSYL